MRLILEPAQGRTEVLRSGGRVLIYVGKVVVAGDAARIYPCTDVNGEQMDYLCGAHSQFPNPSLWRITWEGWTTHVYVPVPFRASPLTRQHPHRVQIRRLLCASHHQRQHLAPAPPVERAH